MGPTPATVSIKTAMTKSRHLRHLSLKEEAIIYYNMQITLIKIKANFEFWELNLEIMTSDEMTSALKITFYY